jgi:hypothetical protein
VPMMKGVLFADLPVHSPQTRLGVGVVILAGVA